MKERISQVWARLEGREFLARLTRSEGNLMVRKWTVLVGLLVGIICALGFFWFEFEHLTKM